MCGTTTMLLNCYNSKMYDSSKLILMSSSDLDRLNLIMNRSKKRKHFQRKIGSVKLAIDTYHGDSHDLLIIADNSIIDLLNGVEYICIKSDYELIVDIGNGER